MAKLTTTTLSGGYGSVSALNANFDAVEAALENTLSRDGTSPNAMGANLDMNSNKIVNLADGVNPNDAVNKSQVDDLLTSAAGAVVVKEQQTASASQTAFTLVGGGSYLPGTNNLSVYRNGQLLHPNAYTETSTTVVTLSSGADAGDEMLFVINDVSEGTSTDTNLRADLASTTAGSGTGLVGFLQAGTGATGRTAQAKLRDVVSVKDFGAVGDGTTNDTTAVAAALAAGVVVYFPPGSYKLQSTITVTNTSLKHIIANGVTFLCDHSGLVANAWTIDFSTNQIPVTIEGATFRPSTTAASGTNDWYGGSFTYNYKQYQRGITMWAGSKVVGCTFSGLEFGLDMLGTTAFTRATTLVDKCTFEQNNSTFQGYLLNGLSFTNNRVYLGSEITFPSVRNCRIENNFVFAPGTPAIDVGGSAAAESQGVVVANNISYGRDGIVSELGIKDLSITNNVCYVTANTPNGVGIGVTTDTGGQEIYRVLIADNQIVRYEDADGGSNVMAYGITIDAAIDKSVKDITIRNNRMKAVRNGIYLEGYSTGTPFTNTTIKDNDIRGATLYGLVGGNLASILAENNLIVGSGSSGIRINNCATGKFNYNETETFTQHYDFEGTCSSVSLRSPIHNAGSESALWKFTSVTGQLACYDVQMPTAAVPGVGQWAVGSRVVFPSEASDGSKEAFCVTAGTPGTWQASPSVWQTPSFSAGDYTGSGAMTWTVASGDVSVCQYLIEGKKMTVNLVLNTTTVGGTPNNELLRAVPAGKTIAKTAFNSAYILDNGTRTTGVINADSSSNKLRIARTDAANYTASADNTYIFGQVTFEIQ